MLVTVQCRLRALRAPKPWNQHPGERVASSGNVQGSVEDGDYGEPHTVML